MSKPKLLKDLGMLFPRPDSNRKVRYGQYECPECSNIFKAISTSINTGVTKSCGCLRSKKKDSLFIIDKESLTQEVLKQEISYNPLTGEFKRLKGKKIAKKLTAKGYKSIMVAGTSYLAHRLAWFYMYGYFPNFIDHIDGNKINNCIYNLRSVTPQENQQNLSIASNNKSGTTGVCFNKKRGIWEARIQVKGKTIHLGRYINKEDAISARKQGELEYGFHKNHGKPKQK